MLSLHLQACKNKFAMQDRRLVLLRSQRRRREIDEARRQDKERQRLRKEKRFYGFSFA